MIREYLQDLLPREKALTYGVEYLTDIELLAIIIRNGTSNKNVLSIAKEIIEIIGDISNLNALTFNQLLNIEGIGKVKAIELLCLIQLANRINEISLEKYIYINNPDVLFDLFKKRYENEKQEIFSVITLNAKNAIINNHVVFIGTLSQSIVHPREIFKKVICDSASSFICIHNHPSGIPTPSDEDYSITKKIAQLSEVFAIPLLDHIIIGKESFYSFKQNKLL